MIFGVNGTGKSTLLSAIVKLFSVWIKSLTKTNYKLAFSDDDITVGQGDLSMSCVVELDSGEYSLERYYTRSRENDRTTAPTYDKKLYELFVTVYQKHYLLNDNGGIPIFAHYSTNRAVSTVPDKLQNSQYDKLSALDRATDQTVDFNKFFYWFRDRESMETIDIREAITRGKKPEEDRMIASVRQSIEAMLDNVSELKIQRDPLRMTVVKEGKEIRVDHLSDGEKCTLALLGDIARRLCLANPKAETPLLGAGVVLIDEVELHMHPSWQRRILPVLTSVFPNVQFILTTHSPQVLGETNDQIKVFAVDSETKAFEEVGRLDGADSSLILEKYMGTDSISQSTQGLIDEINKAILLKRFEAAEEMLFRLKAITGENSENYILAKGFLERSKVLHA